MVHFSSQVVQRSGHSREVSHEGLIVGCQATERSDFRNVGRPGPCGYGGHLVCIAANPLTAH